MDCFQSISRTTSAFNTRCQSDVISTPQPSRLHWHAQSIVVSEERKPFDATGLHPEVVRALQRQGFEAGTDVQSAAIPAVLGATDVVVAAETGSGKTLAYLAPLFSVRRRRKLNPGLKAPPMFSKFDCEKGRRDDGAFFQHEPNPLVC